MPDYLRVKMAFRKNTSAEHDKKGNPGFPRASNAEQFQFSCSLLVKDLNYGLDKNMVQATFRAGDFMNKIAIAAIFFPMLAFSQQNFEASGQTPVFFLKAGAATKPASIVNLQPKAGRIPNCFVADKYTAIRVRGLKDKTKVSIYNASGKLMSIFISTGDGPASFSFSFPSGIYFARFTTVDKQLAVPLNIRK